MKEELKIVTVNLDIDRIIEILRQYLDICNPKVEELKEMKLKKFQYFLLSSIIRISVNIKALILLFPSYKEDGTFKLPINLIMRSIVSDYLTIQYLLTFHDPKDEKNIAIDNEISVLSLDFLKFQEDLLVEELSYLQKNNIAPWTKEKVAERIDKFYRDNIDFYIEEKQEFKLKPIRSFRSTTSSVFFEEEKDRNSKITDKQKFDRLKSLGKDEFGMPAYLPYKYFSQFQHPTSNMDELIMSDPAIIDNRMMLMSIDLIFVMTIQVFRNTISDSKELELSIKKLQDDLLKLTKK